VLYTTTMKTSPSDAFSITVQKKQKRFRKMRDSQKTKEGIGEFFFLIDITATDRDVYIPLSIASGKKPTGFIYQIEGTAEGTISTTNISCKGVGVMQVTLGTLLYCKIPKGKTATFRILIEMRGKIRKEYRIVIGRIQYKYDPSDARYQKVLPILRSDSLTLE
jgi:hypothetical protein